MGLKGARFKGKAYTKGRPKEHAKAEIMLMHAEQKMSERSQRRNFFIFLDIVTVASFAAAVYSFYQGHVLNGFLTFLVGAFILSYFLIRSHLRNKRKKKK